MNTNARTLALTLATLATTVGLAAPAGAVTVCPGANAVYGIDVSEFQGAINWGSVKAAGKDFAIIRVSDGTGHLDPDFAANWSGAKNAGLIRGAYQFFEPSEDPVAQANLLLSHMGAIGQGDLPPMIDVEVTDGQSPATITAKIHSWINTIQAATGRKPLIYTGGWFWNPDVASGDFTGYPLVDSYYCSNCCPDIATPWTAWSIWQYSSTGAVGGISGNVDLDRFDGTMADLEKLAGGGADWGATYVSQSWPLASTALDMVVNQSLPGNIVMKNSGGKSWDASTRLGTTQPRDRSSVFVAPDWLAPNRAANCKAGAAPGANCNFAFTWHAPDAPGDYHEYFNLVQEGVAWFSDPGQGGPVDNDIEVWIHVSQADYHAEFVAQSYPGAPTAVQVQAGTTVAGWIDLKNVGNQPWKAGITKLAPTARDQASPLAAADWLSPTRVSTMAADVAPGAVGRFPLSLQAPAQGDYTQTFTLVEEGVTWFGDAPKGGGPPDDLLKVHVVVTADPPPAQTDDAGTPPPVATDDAGTPPPVATDDGGTIDQPTPDAGHATTSADAGSHGGTKDEPDAGMRAVSLSTGCSVAVGGGASASSVSLLGLLGLALLVTRRRRARC